MTEPDDYDLDDNEDFDSQPRENHNLKRLREKAKGYDEAVKAKSLIEQERDQAKRELAFVRAGIDLDSPSGKLAAKAYDGEPSLDAVKQFAVEYGLIQPDEEEMDQQAALQRLSGATRGAQGSLSGREITPDTYAGWDRATRDAFRSEHPRLAEALKRGQSVPSVAGF